MDELDGDNLNDIIRNALNMALQQGSGPGDSAVEAEGQDSHDNLDTNLAAQGPGNSVAENENDGDDDEEANRHLLQQLQAVMREGNLERETITTHYDIDPSLTGESHDTAPLDSTLPAPAPVQKKKLSIAETLALSRNRMKSLKQANTAEVHDPMTQRYGLVGRNIASTKTTREASRPETSSRMMIMASRMGAGGPVAAAVAAAVKNTAYNLPRSRQTTRDTTKASDSTSNAANEANDVSATDEAREKSVEIDAELDNNILRSLMMAKEAADAEADPDPDADANANTDPEIHKDTAQELYSSETMDAVQAVLQALSRTYENENSSESSIAQDIEHASSDAIGDDHESDAAAIRPNSRSSTSKTRRNLSGRSGGLLTSEEKERIRQENRLRKKKWRDFNSERNKDNDLRARLHRSATKMFGHGDSVEKSSWVREEFEKRRLRRLQRDGGGSVGGGGRSGNGIHSRAARHLAKDLSTRRYMNGLTGTSENSDMDFNAAVDALNRSGQLDLGEAVNNLVKDPSILRSMIDMLAEESGSSEMGSSSEKPSEESSATSAQILPAATHLPTPRPPPFKVNEKTNKISSSPATTDRAASSESVSSDAVNDNDKAREKVRSLGFPPMIGLQSSQRT